MSLRLLRATLALSVMALFVALPSFAAAVAPGGSAPATVSAGEDGLTPSCSAADFGARGDDEADDRAALQEAIDQCAVVNVPAGRYLVSPQAGAAFDLNVPAGRSIVGDDLE